MRPPNLKPIWTPEDFRAMVTALRAQAAPEHPAVAPVVDLFTREVIA